MAEFALRMFYCASHTLPSLVITYVLPASLSIVHFCAPSQPPPTPYATPPFKKWVKYLNFNGIIDKRKRVSTVYGTDHLSDAMEGFAMKAEGLLKQHLVLHSPLIREGSEVGQVSQSPVHVVFVPK